MLGLFIWFAHLEAMVCIGMIIFYASLSSATRLQMGFRPAILAIAIPPIAFAMPKLLLLHIVYFLIVPVFAGRRNQIVPTYVFALMLLPDFRSPVEIGSLHLFYGTIYDSLGAGAILTMLMRFPVRSRITAPGDVPFLLILLVMLFCRGRDGGFTNFLRVCVEMGLVYGVPYYIASRGVRTIDDLKRVMLHMAAAAVMISVIMCYETLRTWPLYRILYSHYGIDLDSGGAVKIRSGRLRATGTSIEATSMAFVLVPCFLATICSRKAFLTTAHYVGLLCLLTVGLFVPQSRGAFVGLLFGITAMNLYMRRQAVVGGVTFMVACLAVATMIVPAETRLGGMLGKSAETASTSDYRRNLLTRGMQEVRKRPILGASEEGVMSHLEDMRQGEGIIDFVNTYLYIALVSGLVGLAMFVAGLGGQGVALWRLRPGLLPRGANLDIFAFVFAGILVPMEMIAFTSLGGRPTSFVMMFIAFAAAIVRERRSATAGRQQVPALQRAASPPSPAGSMAGLGEWREPFPKDLGRLS